MTMHFAKILPFPLRLNAMTILALVRSNDFEVDMSTMQLQRKKPPQVTHQQPAPVLLVTWQPRP